MSNTQLLEMINLLTDESKNAIETIVKNLLMANDPDYIKLTPEEQKNLETALNSNDKIPLNEFKKELGI